MIKRKKVEYILEDKCYFFLCPHCDSGIQVSEKEINCNIFRHGIMKKTGKQINPHAKDDECKILINNDLVYGCCGMFSFIRNSEGVIEYADVSQE